MRSGVEFLLTILLNDMPRFKVGYRVIIIDLCIVKFYFSLLITKTITLMKKYLFRTMLVLFALCAVTTSCSDDDDDVSSNPLVGVWHAKDNDETSQIFMQFNADGTGQKTIKEMNTSGQELDMSLPFTYTYNPAATSRQLQIHFNGNDYVTTYDVLITGNQLSLTSGGSVQLYIRGY